MRKVCLIVLCLVLRGFPALVYGQTQTIDGHSWEALGIAQPIIVAGFMEGYQLGKALGLTKGAMIAGAVFPKHFCSNPGTKECDTSKLLALKGLAEAAAIAFPKEQSGRTIDFYVKEIGGFYQTFPLCRRRDMFFLFSELMGVWSGEKSYKEVGERCLESPK